MAASSHAMTVRNAALARVRVLPYFANFRRFATSKLMQVQPQDIPFASVYFLREGGTVDGDVGVGEPKFIHDLTLGLSVVVAINNPVGQEEALDAAFEAIMEGVLQSAGFMHTYGIEGYSRFNRTHEFGTLGSTNELPIGELRLELGIRFRSQWPPVITDDLLVIHEETVFPLAGTPQQVAGTQQVKAQWNLEQNP
jgi:hypothetical protein